MQTYSQTATFIIDLGFTDAEFISFCVCFGVARSCVPTNGAACKLSSILLQSRNRSENLHCLLFTWSFVLYEPRSGFGVVRIDLLRFLAGCHKRRLNQALSVLSLSLGFFWCMCCAVNCGHFFWFCYFYVICVFCRLVVLVRLSVPVQVIDWKDSSPK